MKEQKIKIIIISVLVILLAGVLLIYSGVNANYDNMQVRFLDVGQGDAELIITPFGQNILIDGGSDHTIIERLSEELPWWDRTIDLMILTHPHDDHIGGQLSVLERYDVKKVLYTGVSYESPLYFEWRELINDKNIQLVLLDKPQTVNLGKDARIEIVYPDISLIGENKNNLNNSSVVLKLTYGDTCFLFTGDIETETEEYLLDKNINLKCEVLKVAHHGSDTSTGEAFLAEVDPGIAIISVGKNNDFGHPSRRVEKRLERSDVLIYRTDQVRTVKLESDGENYTIIR